MLQIRIFFWNFLWTAKYEKLRILRGRKCRSRNTIANYWRHSSFFLFFFFFALQEHFEVKIIHFFSGKCDIKCLNTRNGCGGGTIVSANRPISNVLSAWKIRELWKHDLYQTGKPTQSVTNKYRNAFDSYNQRTCARTHIHTFLMDTHVLIDTPFFVFFKLNIAEQYF